MPKFQIDIKVEDYWRYVIEAADEQETRDLAQRNFDDPLGSLRTSIDVTKVSDDTPLGDN